MTIYLELTRAFNTNRTRAIVCSGQAVVLHRLAIASKDGDWILREEVEDISHIRAVLEARNARYRFGAPLDLAWLRGGWSSHLEFEEAGLRVRTDFFTRPPRLTPVELAQLWRDQDGRDPAYTGPLELLRIKQTAREKDWPVVGELARMLKSPEDQLLHSRSARDLLALIVREPELAARLERVRPALSTAGAGLDELRMALERERFAMMDQDEARLRRYIEAARPFQERWPQLSAQVAGMALSEAHSRIVHEATRCLPTTLPATDS